MVHIKVFIYFLVCFHYTVLRIKGGQGQNNQSFGALLVSVKSIEKVTSTINKSRNIVTGGKRRYFASKLLPILYKTTRTRH